MSDKSLMDAIEDLLTESIADDINKITADNVKDGANLKPTGGNESPDTQGVLGSTSGQALDAGGDKDVGPSGKKGHFPSQASSDTQGVLGSTSGSAMDAGGDTDVGGSKGDNASDASDNSSEVLGSETGAALDAGGDKDVGKLKEDLEEEWEFFDEETGEALTEEEIEALALEVLDYSDEDLEEAMNRRSYKQDLGKALAKSAAERGVNKQVSLAGPGGKKITATKTGSTEPGKRYTTEDLDFGDVEFTAEEIEALVAEGFDHDEIMSFFTDEEVVTEEVSDELVDRLVEMCKSKKRAMKEAQEPETTGGKSYPDANKEMRPEQEKDVNPQNKGGDPMGSTKGAALDAGGDKDVAPAGKKGQYPSEASADTQGVLGKTKGAAMDAGGDKDVGKLKEEDELEEKLHGDQHKLDHDHDGDIDAEDMKDVRKKGATAHLTKEEAEDESLSEDFKARAEVIFEAAVGEKVSMIREEMEAEYATKLEEETARLNEQVAQYVDEAVSEWLKENALEVRYSLRTEIAEGFMKGLKNLFQESYIEIPEEDASVVDELTEAVEEQRDTIATLEEELKESRQFILEARRKDVLAQLTEDLTATQAVRLEKLAENLEAADVEEFKGKVEKLKEGYFDPSNEQPLIGSLTEEVLTGEEFIAEDDQSSVSQYAKFLSKTVLK